MQTVGGSRVALEVELKRLSCTAPVRLLPGIRRGTRVVVVRASRLPPPDAAVHASCASLNAQQRVSSRCETHARWRGRTPQETLAPLELRASLFARTCTRCPTTTRTRGIGLSTCLGCAVDASTRQRKRQKQVLSPPARWTSALSQPTSPAAKKQQDERLLSDALCGLDLCPRAHGIPVSF
jgi:hypothetical protein